MSYENWSLDDWVNMFKTIYGKQNKGVSDEILLLHLVEEVSELAEDLRKEHIKPRKNKKGELEGVLINVPDSFAWLTTLLFKRGTSLQEIVWHKFPNVCPYCFYEKNCICISQMVYMAQEEREKTLDTTYRKNREKMPKTLYEWEKMFNRIYGNVNRIQSTPQIGFHLMEEVGEISKELRVKDEAKMNDEIADAFAWLIGMILKVRYVLDDPDIRFDKLLWDRYPGMCQRCKASKCECSSKVKLKPRE